MATIDLGKVKIVWKGAWSASTTYEPNDVVTQNSATWICTQGYTFVSGNRRTPGLRDRTNAYGVQFDPDKNPRDVYLLQKTGGKFYIDGRRNPGYTGTGSPITLYRGQTYRFQTYHSTMSGVTFQFCTSTDGTTYTNGVTVVGTPGISGSYVQITVPQDAPATLYYKQSGTAAVADTSSFTIADTWEGFLYWEQICEGFTWKGTYNAATQYYRNDVVELNGSSFIAKADSLGKYPDMSMQAVVSATNAPGSRGFWSTFSGSGAMRDPGRGAWLANHGPMDWPYPHTQNTNPVFYENTQHIARGGRVYVTGTGTSNSSGILPAQNSTRGGDEIQFYFTNWLRSRDNLPRYTTTKSATATGALTGDTFDYVQRKPGQHGNAYYGKNDLTTPHGKQPRCIQIDGSYDHNLYLFDNGEVHHGGYASNGNSGAGSTSVYTGMPLRVQNLEGVKIKKVAIGISGTGDSTHHCMALDEDGRVWTWGYNAYGQCGTGHSNNVYAAYQIPKEYFNNQRVIDIAITGNATASSYVRTESNEIWSWGYNAVGQLGLGDTTNRWRPNKVTAFDPAANSGILKWQVCGDASSASLYILDGAGYMWHAGYNGYGQGISADTANHPTLTRSTQSPTAGTTTNFWACHSNGYTMVWMRTSNGNTYFCGYNASGYYHAGTGDNVSKSVPTLVVNVTNLKQVWSFWDYTTFAKTMWLTDNGQLWAQGYVNFSWNNNYQASSGPSLIENGVNYYPYRCAIPGGAKIQQIWCNSDDSSTNQWGPYILGLADNGTVYFSGANFQNYNYSNKGGNHYYVQGTGWMPITKGR